MREDCEIKREDSLLLSRSCFLLEGCVDALEVVETSCRSDAKVFNSRKAALYSSSR